ncbi:CsgG/HfaB family protein [Teredinibacter sp. KSP-S5-2]|uniref:CsgG/HfaB family protein n=1 Tax=Teredinibacter sp. KSP-S5-2 TaxID=3034506 RepID=UPI00293479FC|nr:CsgG/HfaB family protein [Teredinibacter sp. KSP-S5-2]WNO07777.1 CsgG/HfaB family protein [Teredinibacter sp. KSP-S5-2]
MSAKSFLTSILLTCLLAGCATTESHKVLDTQKVDSYGTVYTGSKTTLVVGKFNNRSSYMQGLFSSNTDLLGNQAKTILKTHLQQTNRFKLVDRENMSEIEQEAKLLGKTQTLKGARYAVTGGVSEFGRKEVGDKQLFGIVGSGKKQIAYAKVSLNVIDVLNSEIVYTTQGAGEYSLSEREVLGFGSNAGYDATLNGKVLNLAITEAVNNFVRDLEQGVFVINP